MKTFILVSALLASFSSFATDFSVKMDNTHCSISKGQVTKTHKIGVASITEKKTVSVTGMETLIQKAAEVSSELPANPQDEFIFQMNHEGKTYTLKMEDSKESLNLVRLLAKICL